MRRATAMGLCPGVLVRTESPCAPWGARRKHFFDALQVGRLDQMQIESGLLRLLTIAGISEPRQGDERDPFEPRQSSYPTGHLVAVEKGQSNVEKHHLGPELLRYLQPAGSIMGDANVVAGSDEGIGENFGQVLVVVHHQNAKI